jgi:hypothetical protein
MVETVSPCQELLEVWFLLEDFSFEISWPAGPVGFKICQKFRLEGGLVVLCLEKFVRCGWVVNLLLCIVWVRRCLFPGLWPVWDRWGCRIRLCLNVVAVEGQCFTAFSVRPGNQKGRGVPSADDLTRFPFRAQFRVVSGRLVDPNPDLLAGYKIPLLYMASFCLVPGPLSQLLVMLVVVVNQMTCVLL